MHGLGVSLECGREKLGNQGPSENWNSLSNCSPWAGVPLALVFLQTSAWLFAFADGKFAAGAL